MIVYDESVTAKRPSIFMQPDWKGVCADTIGQARTVAGKDYVVLMADMFGAGYGAKPKTQSTNCAPACSPCTKICPSRSPAAARPMTRCRPRRKSSASPMPARSWRSAIAPAAAMSLEQARAGADFKALVVFHVTNPNPVVAGTPCNIKGRVLAIHGSADPVTPKPMMDAFEDELTKAKVDWQVMMFGPPAVHSFCDPTAKGPATQLRRKALPQILHADARLFRRDAVMLARWRPARRSRDGNRLQCRGRVPRKP